MTVFKRVVIPFISVVVAVHTDAATTPSVSPADLQFFENKIRPILAANCLECHSADKGKVKGGLNMDTRADMLNGGENGIVIKPGDLAGSALVRAIEWNDATQMPPKKKLSLEEITVLKEWIVRGAPDPRGGSTAAKAGSLQEHWAYKPVRRLPLPKVQNEAWCRNSIDRFVMAKLEEKGLLPANGPDTGSPEERRFNKEALLRRVCFDLVGLPPSLEQIKSFTESNDPNIYEKVIDSLLASPSYGERWARHWMDTVRYSDTSGIVGADKGNPYRFPYAWTYRDWIIKAMNEDMPYDNFILNQLAADKLSGNADTNLAALGFITVGTRFRNDKDAWINERIDVVGRGLLGLTLACARCHEHKFDPIKQADYYALHGVFSSIKEPENLPVIGVSGSEDEARKFNEGLQKLERAVYAKFYEFVYQQGQRFRQKPGAYFAAGRLGNKKATVDEVKQTEAIVAQEKLEERLYQFVKGRGLDGGKSPVSGPFQELIEGKAGAERALMLEGKSKRSYNRIVLDFLKKTNPLPTDPDGVAALFEKFIHEKVEPLTKPDPNSASPSGAIFKLLESLIQNPKLPVTAQDRELIELVMYPFHVVMGVDLNMENMAHLAKSTEIFPLQTELGRMLNVDQVNDYKLHAKSQPVRAMTVEDLPKPVNSPVYPRGNRPQDGIGTPVPRRFLEILTPGKEPAPFQNGSGRLELAQAIVSKNNPLTARVLVNRMWMYHFGEGLVRTPDDLGNQAGKPTHPELLDFLSAWFMEDYGAKKPGWSMKALHKAILLSNTYQQSCRTVHLEKQQIIDPENAYLWRANIRRLDFEAFRDSFLSMSNAIDFTMYGPPVNIVDEPISYRRSVYGYIDRGNVPDLLSQFDLANPTEPNTKRAVNIVPQQALFLMNSPFVISAVQRIAQRQDVQSVKNDQAATIHALFRIILQRTPNAEEMRMAHEFLESQKKNQEKFIRSMGSKPADATALAEREIKKDQLESGKNDKKGFFNSGGVVKRIPFSPVETLIQTLMFSNSTAYLR